MKKWLVNMLKKVIENTVVNGLRYLLGLLLISIASIPIVQEIISSGQADITVKKWLLILPYSVVALIVMIFVIYRILRFTYKAHLSWDYIFGLNQHILYIDKTKLEFIKTLTIIPLSENVNQAIYDYNWTGSEIESVTLKRIEGEALVGRDPAGKILNKGPLVINFNENLAVLKKHECDISYQLSNKNNAMERKLIITVKRPTLKSLLRIVTNPSVRLRNVNASVYNIFGDKRNALKTLRLTPKKFGNHADAQIYYEWEITHPKLFSKYEITWDIV